ncbi:MAG: zinc-dependent peptidase [Pseudomonadales bacterium]
MGHPLKAFARWRMERLLHRHGIADELWLPVLGLNAMQALSAEEQTRLRELTTLFLHRKSFHGTHGFVVEPYMQVVIAAQACLLVLNLGLEYFRGWRGVVLYETGFIARHEYQDEDGIVHQVEDALDGEAWEQGPVILSWEEVQMGLQRHPDDPPFNVVLHEFAHKLDFLSGDANGCPPLHRDVSPARWKAAFLETYETLCSQVDHDEPTAIDPYAAESPAELFAVASESFFEAPTRLRVELPEVYRQLAAFYRLDPAARASATAASQMW